MLFTSEALLLGSRYHIAIFQQRRRTVMIISRNAEYV